MILKNVAKSLNQYCKIFPYACNELYSTRNELFSETVFMEDV